LVEETYVINWCIAKIIDAETHWMTAELKLSTA